MDALFEVSGQIGSNVYRAIRKSTVRPVALKVIPNAFTRGDKFAQRTYRQVAYLELLRHPNIVRLDQVLFVRDAVVLVCELGSRDLRGGVPEDDRQLVAGQLLSALAYLESARIVHRDVQPKHVLVSKRGAKLTGFHAARHRGEDVVEDSWIANVNYASNNDNVDVWAFGCVLVEMDLGHMLFPGDSELAVAKQHQDLFENKVTLVSMLGAVKNSRLYDVAELASLCFEPDYTATEALLHPYCKGVATSQFRGGPLYAKLAAAHCRDALDAGGAPWPARDYEIHLRARQHSDA